jgi:cytochrome c peroxidase
MWGRILVLAALLASAVCFAVYRGGSFRSTPARTPLAGFSAPFVYGKFQVPEDNPLTEESVTLGRRLFYDPRLSGDNTVSCSTCHIQRLAFTDGKRTGVGASGKPLAFNTMSLANVLWGPRHFFWNGRAPTLEQQARFPLEHPDEMGQNLARLADELGEDPIYRKLFAAAYGEVSLETVCAALASFERTLISSNSRYDRFLRGELALSDLEEHGRKLFLAHPDVKADRRGANCIDCHSQFLTGGFSTGWDGFANNGLDEEGDLPAGLQEVTGKPEHRGLFKVPTLRNIAITGPYMHDGRFTTLEEVLDHYNSGIKKSRTLSALIREADNLHKTDQDNISLHLTEMDKTALLAFLQTLTDEDFVTDERFSNPFGEN